MLCGPKGANQPKPRATSRRRQRAGPSGSVASANKVQVASVGGCAPAALFVIRGHYARYGDVDLWLDASWNPVVSGIFMTCDYWETRC